MSISEIKPGKLLELTGVKSEVTNPFREAVSLVDDPILEMKKTDKDLYEEWLDSYGGNLADSCDSDTGSLSNSYSY